MKKRYFFGKYYKFITHDGFSFAVIISYSDEGDAIQVITQNNSYQIIDTKSVYLIDNKIVFNINQNNLSMSGEIIFDKLHPLKREVMGPFSFIPFMQCKHDIYSMYHGLSGHLIINNITYDFNHGYGYIEGDKGCSFPNKYIWYNSVKEDHGITLAIATIPFGLIKFIGLLCFVKTKNKEYYLSTYNFARAIKISESQIIIKKRKYKLVLNITSNGGKKLKAPDEGKMSRYIKENLAMPSSYQLLKNNMVIIEDKDNLSSLEYMFEGINKKV